MLITIISPDKLTLSMFANFYKSVYCQNVHSVVKDMNCLYSADTQEKALRSIVESYPESVVLIKYKIKPQTVIESISLEVIEQAKYAICFKDMYSLTPIVLKGEDTDAHLNEVLSRWLKST